MLSRLLIVGLIFTSTLSAKATFAAPDEYDDSQSNPFRIAAYLMHPVGWLAEWIVFRPFHFMVSATEPQEAFFGHRPHPPVLAEPQPLHNYGVAKKVPTKEANLEPKAPPPPPPPRETVRIVEVPVERGPKSRRSGKDYFSGGSFSLRLRRPDRAWQRSGLFGCAAP
jgi:hypothetical protein